MQKISKYKTATTYAQAWFSAAKDNHIEDKVFEEIRLLKESMAENGELWGVLMQPVDDNNDKVKIMNDIAKKAKFSAVSEETLKMIAENNRLNILKMICGAFTKIYYQDKGIVEVTVDTAVELSETQDGRLKKTLENKLKSPVIINYRIKPEVLGGLAVRFNSWLVDDTISGKLKKLKQYMLDRHAV